MPLKSAEFEEPTINLTAMLDMVFNLIIFFVVSMQFSREEQVEVNVPSATHAKPMTAAPDDLVVTVSKAGQFFMRVDDKDKLVGSEELLTRLIKAKENFADQSVLVRGDGQVIYQKVIDAMSLCREAGIENVSVATQPPLPAN